MSMKQKIFTTLIRERKSRTGAQLAARFGTTVNSIAARVSELRDEGYNIQSCPLVDTKGRVKYFYRYGKAPAAQR